MNLRLIFILIIGFINISSYCQSLLDELKNETTNDTIFAEATFKSTRIISGHSIENIGRGDMNLVISHRFGNISSGVHQLYGLDASAIRLGLEYGLLDRLDVGFGRSRDQELIDTYLKYRLFRQSSGAYNFPVTISLYTSVAITPQQFSNQNISFTIVDRMSYVNEILIARKISDKFSMQISPGFVHRNLTETKKDKNFSPYIGTGGRLKVTNRIALSAEYYWVKPGLTDIKVYDPLSIGIDIETGGHIFQLHFTNSRGMNERLMIPENYNDWLKGDFGFGFNIVRHFNLKRQ